MLRRRWTFSADGAAGLCRREKNWGFFEEDGALLITYALLPCTIILEFVPSEPDSLRLRSRHCYTPEAAAILQTSGARHLISFHDMV